MTTGTAVREVRQAALDRARPALLRGSDLVGRATSRARVLPELLICGGQRCGTTSLYQALVQQPTLFRPVWRKGVHWFDVHQDRDRAWYRSHFPLRSQLDRAERTHGTRALAFESSPYYLFHPLAPARIAAELPGVHVVVLVRDPVERARSAHAHERARGFEPLDLEAALDAEDERLAGEEERLAADPSYLSLAHRHQAYRARGEYAVQLDRLTQHVPASDVTVLDSGRFFADPAPVLAGLLDRLGVEQRVDTAFEQHNARPVTPLPERLRRRLDEHFAPHDAALERWLGHTPSWRSS